MSFRPPEPDRMRNVLLPGSGAGVVETPRRRRELPPATDDSHTGLTGRKALRVLAYLVVLLGCLLLSGQLPMLTASTATTIPHESFVQCLANHGLGRWPLSCPDIGLPTGSRLMQGLPVLLLGWALTMLPGISAHVAVEITDVLVVVLALEGARRLLRRFGVGDVVSLGAAALYVVSPSVLALVSFNGTYWGMLLLPAILELDAIVFEPLAKRNSGARAGCSPPGCSSSSGYCSSTVIRSCSRSWPLLLLLPAGVRGLPRRTATGVGAAFLGGTLAAYAVYQAYVPGGDYARSSIDLVRAMGLDVLTLIQPSPMSGGRTCPGTPWTPLGSGVTGPMPPATTSVSSAWAWPSSHCCGTAPDSGEWCSGYLAASSSAC